MTIAFRQAVIDGMFTPLGEGDVDISGVIRTLEAAGYRGWYVLEQDASLAEETGRAVKAPRRCRRQRRVPAAAGCNAVKHRRR